VGKNLLGRALRAAMVLLMGRNFTLVISTCALNLWMHSRALWVEYATGLMRSLTKVRLHVLSFAFGHRVTIARLISLRDFAG
jgi:hypothetical protein